MRQVIKAQGKDGFAFMKDFKFIRGTKLDLVPFPHNVCSQ
jgi:hypothetical protein